ncbi:hypothetical protein [Caballeronia sp. dw_19]|uniref:hypothetical protein n=1 Tax=Caballeronia sp. dw_19 TaxID=2719791 RepID=UPI001BD33555|nr:hypothetical protein [Caballeronia sp. dw_19]
MSKALAIARLPDVILDAFEAREVIGFGVAEKLVTIRREVGLDAMCLHAGALFALPNKLPVKRVLAVLANGELAHFDSLANELENLSSRRRDGESLPLVVAANYYSGVKAGHWTSGTGAAKYLNHSASRVSLALRIAALPEEVIDLFGELAPLTFEIGKKLLSLKAALGPSKLGQNARSVYEKCEGLNANERVDAIASGRRERVDNSFVTLTVGPDGRSLRVSSDRIDLLIAARAEIKRFLEVIVRRPSTSALFADARRGHTSQP